MLIITTYKIANNLPNYAISKPYGNGRDNGFYDNSPAKRYDNGDAVSHFHFNHLFLNYNLC